MCPRGRNDMISLKGALALLPALSPGRLAAMGAVAAFAVGAVWQFGERRFESGRHARDLELADATRELNRSLDTANAAADAAIAAGEARRAAALARTKAGMIRQIPQCARDCSLTEAERAAVKEVE